MRKRQLFGMLGPMALLSISGAWIVGGARQTAATAAPAEAPPSSATEAPKREPDVIFVPTPQPVVDTMLKVAEVKKGDMVYDLGCGDGRIVITAAQKYGARGIGVDIDPERIKESNENAQKAKVTDRVKFVQQDLFTMDFKDADVVALYLLPALNVKLRPKLMRELRPGTRIVSHAFDMGDWKPDKTLTPEGRTVHYWVIPAQVAGTWQWTTPGQGGEERYTLQLKQTYQNLSGTLQAGNRTLPVADGKLTGDQISLTVGDKAQGQKGMMRMTGRVSGDSIQGALQSAAGKRDWTAKRTEKAAPASSS